MYSMTATSITLSSAADIPIEQLYQHPVVQELLQKIEHSDLDKEIKVPYLIKDKTLMSPGVWNGYFYSSDAIDDAFLKTEWNRKEIRSLFLDHEDLKSREWIGEVVNPRRQGENLVGDLVIVDKPTAMKLAYGAKMGISPKVSGQEDGGKMATFKFDNFSVVINPAVKTAYINNQEVTKMSDENVKTEDQPQEKPQEETGESGQTDKAGEDNKETVENKETTKKSPSKSLNASSTGKTKQLNEDASFVMDALCEIENAAKIGDIAKKAKEIKKKYPDMKWSECIKKASKLSEEEKPEEETPEEEEKKSMSDKEILEKAVEILSKKSKPEGEKELKKEEHPDLKEAKKEMAETEKKVVEMAEEVKKKDEIINELSQRLEKVEGKLNEPDRQSVKTQEMSQVAEDPDMAFMNMLKGM